jgi:hypothetical protein
MEEWRYSSTNLDLGTRWTSGQLHAPTALPPEKEPPIPIGKEAGWTPESVWMLRRREKYLTPAGNRTPAVHPLARIYTD